MARISTHILDTSRGVPAVGVTVDLYSLDSNGAREHVTTAITNDDGRTGEPLLHAAQLTPGIYELVFHAGDYFHNLDLPMTEPPFLDQVVIRFGVSAVLSNYHVPLLLSPYGYSTYRGS